MQELVGTPCNAAALVHKHNFVLLPKKTKVHPIFPKVLAAQAKSWVSHVRVQALEIRRRKTYMRERKEKSRNSVLKDETHKMGRTCYFFETWVSCVTVRRPRLAEAERVEEPGTVGRISGSSGATRNSGLRMPGPSDWARRWASRKAGCFLCLDWKSRSFCWQLSEQ